MRRELLPQATLITPNLPEAAMLLGITRIGDENQAIEDAAAALHHMGAPSVLIKGGHGSGAVCSDCLLHNGRITWFSAEKLPPAIRMAQAARSHPPLPHALHRGRVWKTP